MLRRLRLEAESHDARMRIAAPVSAFSEVHIKGDDSEVVHCGPSEDGFVITLSKASFGGVDDRVTILA
jgi:hypothetical protein